MNIKDLVEEAGYTVKRKASCHGGEFSSPCPFCKEGKDRFLIWPERNNKSGELQGGRFSCRVCGKYGDGIKFLIEYNGLTYREACEKLKIIPKEKNQSYFSLKPKYLVSDDPPELWQEKAKLFIDWCHFQLLKNSEIIELLVHRGFTLESIKKFKLGYCTQTFFRNKVDWGLPRQLKENGQEKKQWLPKGITIPTLKDDIVVKIKVRRTDFSDQDPLPKYVEISGSKNSVSLFGNSFLECVLILESELDALLIQQFASDLIFCIALGGSTKPLDYDTERLLRGKEIILFCPDFDKAGQVAWEKWKKIFVQINKIYTPDGKAPGDAYLTEVNLREWIESEIVAARRRNSKTLH